MLTIASIDLLFMQSYIRRPKKFKDLYLNNLTIHTFQKSKNLFNVEPLAFSNFSSKLLFAECSVSGLCRLFTIIIFKNLDGTLMLFNCTEPMNIYLYDLIEYHLCMNDWFLSCICSNFFF